MTFAFCWLVRSMPTDARHWVPPILSIKETISSFSFFARTRLRKLCFLFFSFFFRAHAIEEALRKDRHSAEKGSESTKKGEGEQQHKEKTQPSPIWANNKCGTMRKAKISHEDAVYWSSPLKQWESSRCIVLIVDPTPSSLANPFIFKRLVPWGIQCWFRCLWQFGFNAASKSERARRVERTEERKTWLKKTMKSVAAKLLLKRF